MAISELKFSNTINSRMIRLLLFVLFACEYANSINETELNLNAIEEIMQVKCIINSKSLSKFNQFREALTKYVYCVVKTQKPDAPHPVQAHNDYCTHLKEGEFRGCVKNLTQDIAPCLDKTESYLPHLILRSLNGSLERLCGDNGFSNTEYMYHTVKNDSMCLVAATGLYLGGGECLSDLTFFKNLDKGIVDLSKSSLCPDLVSLPKCVIPVLERECNGSYSRFVDLISQPFIEGCAELENENNFK